jgi:hypothetical protein
MVLSFILLAIALILPIYVVIESSNLDFQDLVHRGPLLDETQIQSYFHDTTVRHQMLFTILAVSESVLVVLFIIAFRASMKP